jgi:prepilin peptidase CpaA
LVAVWIFGAADVGNAGGEAEEIGGRDSSGCEQKRRGGAGAIRDLSRNRGHSVSKGHSKKGKGPSKQGKMTAQVWIAILVGLAAIVDDLKRRQIANWIPAAALAGGFGWQIGQSGWMGSLYALGGAVAGFSVFLLFYLLGGMGGGDVKLMAGFGALLGARGLVEAALWTAGVGGILAILAIAFKAARGWFKKEKSVQDAARKESIPYAPAIALGVWLSLVPKG